MRIIAGAGRGRRIFSVPKRLETVRPISGRMRQSLFDIIRPRVTGSHFLDLFAGTGAVGLEALSRGASRVVFVERDQRCLEVIEKNLERIGWLSRAAVLRGDAAGPLSWVVHRSGVEGFDIVFMGPPYKDERKQPLRLTAGVVANVAASGIVAEGGWVVCQHHKKEDPGSHAALELFRRSKYGDSLLSFFRRRLGPAPPAAGAPGC